MSVILFVLGILFTGVGIVLVGFAVPINESAIGQTLIIAGAVAIVGGPVLVGMGATVSQLAQIATGLKAKPANRTGRVAAAVQRAEEIFPDPHALDARSSEGRSSEARVGSARTPDLRMPEPAVPEPLAVEAAPAHASVAASPSAIDRLRASMARPGSSAADVEDVPLSPNGSQHPTAPALDTMSPMEAAPAPKAPEPTARVSSPADGGAKEPRLDFLFRSRPTRPPSPESFDSMWPKRSAPRAPAEPAKVERAESAEHEEQGATATMTLEPPPTIEERRAAPVIEERQERRMTPRVTAPSERPTSYAPTSHAEEARPMVAILKSGVVDGMAYTLYADGSIEAQLPQGTVRFGSIAELRAHIENNS